MKAQPAPARQPAAAQRRAGAAEADRSRQAEAAPGSQRASPATATEADDELRRRTTREDGVVRSRLRWCAASPRNTTSTSRRFTAPGISGRVTKQDILGYIESGEARAAGSAPAPGSPAGCAAASAGPYQAGRERAVVPMSVMRKKIAEHMVLSAHTSPHVYSVYEVNFARVAKLRDKKKAEFEAAGAKLTFTAFIAKVAIDALRQFPIVNASIDGDNIVYKKDINLGIAVALENGLIVPVIRNADEKNLLGLTRAINDLADRARSKKLNPEEVQGGTFTITNPGIFGALYGLPLINQPQVAILGVGTIEKRAVVIDDAIAIRPMCHITLGHDHRLVDGADAGRFLRS